MTFEKVMQSAKQLNKITKFKLWREREPEILFFSLSER